MVDDRSRPASDEEGDGSAQKPAPLDPTLAFGGAAAPEGGENVSIADRPTILPVTGAPTLGESASGGAAQDGNGPVLRRFGDYDLLNEVARGGMGVVYRARQVSLNRIVALKMILAGNLASEQDVKRFYTEAEAAAHLHHAGIVSVHAVGEHDGQHFFSMDFVEGVSLAELVRDHPLPPAKAAEYLEQTACAMQYAHERGILHRDLKPSNVLVDGDDAIRITDFGLAKRMGAEDGLTTTGQVMGTPAYMPPEQAAGRVQDMSPASDVYSMGAILYELLTGRPPFRAETPLDTLMQVLDNEVAPPRLLNPRIPRDLETVCLKSLQKDSRLRYASAAEFAADLRRFQDGLPISAASINLLDRVASALSHNRGAEQFRGWGLALIVLGGIIFVSHLSVYVLQAVGAGPLVGVGLPRAIMFGLILALLRYARPQSLLPTNAAERPVWAIWIGYLAALAAVSCALALEGQDHLRLYPLAAALSGLCFFAMGGVVWGGSYAIGLAYFVASPLLAVFRESSPLWFGLLWGLALLAFGSHYRRQG